MAAVDVEIADAVVAALEAGSFSMSIQPVRSYAEWDDELEDMNELHVDVVPVSTGPGTTLEERGGVEYACQVDIAVRYRFGTVEQQDDGRIAPSEVDSLKLLLQEIAEYFMTDRLADTTTAIWQSTEIQQSWSRPHLKQFRQYFGFIRLAFTANRSL